MVLQDPHYPNLRILNLKAPPDWQRLRLLVLEHPRFGLHNLADQPPLRLELPYKLPHAHFLDLLCPDNPHGIGARWCVIEGDYVDRDSAIIYAKLFSRAFRDHPRRTIRLHFFSDRIEELTYDSLLSQDSLQSAYLGFIVLGQEGTIGRTVLPPPKDSYYWYFIPAQSSHSVNLAGAELEARGTPFIEQDGKVAACASAAIWMSSTVLRRQFGHDMLGYSMAEITSLATEHSTPSSGVAPPPSLKTGQILWALHRMGYEPMLFWASDAQESLEAIYRSIESGIPPILIIYLPHAGTGGYHAVTAFGHAYDAGTNPNAAIAQKSRRVSIWYPYFLVHDDQMGAYLKLTVTEPNPYSGECPGISLDAEDSYIKPPKELLEEWYKDAYLYAVITSLPPRHTLPPNEGFLKALHVLRTVYRELASRYGERCHLPAPAIHRFYFIASNKWKQAMLPFSAGGRPGLQEELARYYRGHIFSKYIWVLEVCGIEHRFQKDPKDLRVIADVILDPTSSADTEDFISVHLPHLFVRMFPGDVSVSTAIDNAIVIPDDTPYQPVIQFSLCQEPLYKTTASPP